MTSVSFTCMNKLSDYDPYIGTLQLIPEKTTRNSHRNARRNHHRESRNYCSRSVFRFWNEKRLWTIVSWFWWGFRFAFRWLFRVVFSGTGCSTIQPVSIQYTAMKFVLYTSRDSFICVTWLIHMSYITHLYLWAVALFIGITNINE